MISWLAIAIAAQAILGSAAVFDKILLRRRAIDAWSYTFWFGILGLFALFLLPFGYRETAGDIVLIGIFSGVLFFASMFFQFWALEKIEASEALPLLGAMSPVFTLFLSTYFLDTSFGLLDILGFLFLVATGFVLFFAERRELRHGILVAIAVSAFLLAASHVSSKIVFTETSFITGFFWVKVGGVLAALVLLFIPALRRLIFRSTEKARPHSRFLYIVNRGYASLGSLLVSGAIFLSDPALVDATQNMRYVVIFLLAWLILREKFRGRVLALKIISLVLITIGLGWLALGEYVRRLPPLAADRPITWGLTFSEKFSSQLGLDWRENYRAIIDELRPSKLRLIAYWDDIEPQEGQFDFTDLDWQVALARERNIPIVMTVGMKTLRWPECHIPAWAVFERDPSFALPDYIRGVVLHYKNESGIVMWQVENEPYLAFGNCPARPDGFLEDEIALVKSLDPSRQILVTDSGEVGEWVRVARQGDIFGTSIYRKIYPRFGGSITGVFQYPIAPEFFRVKERFVRWIDSIPDKKFIVHELQAEPWSHLSLNETLYQEQLQLFSPAYFRDTIDYAEQAGFDEYYLWGAEWWYWMKEKHGNSAYWDIARDMFRDHR